MKFTVAQPNLLAALRIVTRAADNGRQHPITSNVLLTADDNGTLLLTATDLSIGIQAAIDASVATAGSTTLPARLLSDIIAKLPAEAVAFTVEDDQTAHVTTTGGTYTLRGLPAKDFPDLPTVDGTTTALPAAQLSEAITAASVAVSSDEAKQMLCGINLNITDRLEAAATDGHRLSVIALQIADPTDPANLKPGVTATISSRGLKELQRILIDDDTVELAIGRTHAAFHVGSTSIYARILNGTYPAYRQLIPSSFSNTITADRKALIHAIQRVAIIADQGNGVVKIASDGAGALVITADNEVGDASESIKCSIAGTPKAAFNASYLLDGLGILPADEVTINLNSPTTPAVITTGTDGSRIYLVMPVQVRES